MTDVEVAARPPPSRERGAPARLKITEIFRSLQGESSSVGWPTVFVRLTGCPLRCQYCDTAYAFTGGQWMDLDDVCAQVQALNTPRVCITGGEPLAQKPVLPLMQRLCDAGYAVSIETSGALEIRDIDPRVRRVMDLKTPDSGECARNLLDNLSHLNAADEVKFVICSRTDFDWACTLVDRHDLTSRCTVLFSPSADQLPARELADWVLAQPRDIRFQTQLHKALWGAAPGR